MPTDPGSRKPHARRPAGDDTPGSRLRATPGGRKVPAGLDRARRRQDAPPRKPRQAVAPRRPNLPADEPAQLPRGARKEIDRVLGKGPRADDVALALSVGSDAIDADRIDVALEALTWAKHEASRVAVVREALGVARYLDGDYAGALSELQAYRRISGRADQNHLIADALRGLERDLDRIVEPLEELLADDAVDDDRRAEAIIIWAAALADHDDLAGARALLRRHLGRKGADEAAPHDLRVHVLSAELAERAEDHEAARHHRHLIARVAPELIELAESDAAGHEADETAAGETPSVPEPETASDTEAEAGRAPEDEAPPTDSGGGVEQARLFDI